MSTFAELWSSCIVGMPADPTLIECEFDRRMPAVPATAKATAASAEIIKIFMRNLYPVGGSPRRGARPARADCPSYVPDIVMWQNATIAALYSRSLHVSGNITRLSGRDDLPFSLGDCHAGEVLHPTHDPRSHPQVLDRFRRRAIRQLNGRASLYGSQRFLAGFPSC